MSATLHITRKMLVAIAAAGFTLAGTAVAQTTEIIVEAPHVERTGDRAPATGAPINLISIRYRVATSDLNLATHSGAQALEQRIKDAAKKGCAEIDKLYPLATPAADDKPCVKTAVDGAMPKAHELIAAAESKAKK